MSKRSKRGKPRHRREPGVSGVSSKAEVESEGQAPLCPPLSILPACAQDAIARIEQATLFGLILVCMHTRIEKTTVRTLKTSLQGISKEDVTRVARYMAEEASVVVHFKPEQALQALLEDGVYRNLFETGTSNGNSDQSARSVWESATFQRAYDNASPKDRPKYGVLNTMNDPRGVFSCCPIYGKAYLKLKNTAEIRSRVTISDRDTSHPNPCCVPCDWRSVLLLILKMEARDLDQVVEVALGRRERGSSFFDCFFHKINSLPYVGYNEVQIHGPLRLAEDVDCIVVDEAYKDDPTCAQQLEDIQKKYGIAYRWESFAPTEEEVLYRIVVNFLFWYRLKTVFDLGAQVMLDFDGFVCDAI